MLSPKKPSFVSNNGVVCAARPRVAIPLASESLVSKHWNPLGLPLAKLKQAAEPWTRYVRRGGKIWIRLFPDKPVTMRPAETRMGSGKGAPEYWVAVVKPGRIMYEMTGVPEATAREAMRLAAHKMPIKTKFVVRTPEET